MATVMEMFYVLFVFQIVELLIYLLQIPFRGSDDQL